MKTDNITNLVFSEIDIKEDNFIKNNFTIYSLDILSEDSDENNNKEDIHSSSSENSIDLDDYNLDIKTFNDLNKIDLNDNSYCIDDSLNTAETFIRRIFFNNFMNSNKYLKKSSSSKKRKHKQKNLSSTSKNTTKKTNNKPHNETNNEANNESNNESNNEAKNNITAQDNNTKLGMSLSHVQKN